MILANDLFHGGGHLPDVNVFSPVFDNDGNVVLFASIQCHHGDTGGAMAGYNVFAKDIWSKEVRYPLLKIVESGRERRDVVLTLRANNPCSGRLVMQPAGSQPRSTAGPTAPMRLTFMSTRTRRVTAISTCTSRSRYMETAHH